MSTGGLPDSVILGGEALRSHVVKYEELSSLLNVLITLLVLHGHNVPGTVLFGNLPCYGITGGPLVDFTSLRGQIPTIKSLQVGVSS